MAKDQFVKKLWMGFGIIIGSAIITAGVIYFFTGAIDAQATAIVNNRAAVEAQTNAVANLASLEHDAPEAVQYQLAMDQLLPSQYGLVNFGQWFSREGGKYGVVSNASLQESMVQPQGTMPGTASFSFDAEGTLTNLTTFLNAATAESSQFLLSFGSFDIVSVGPDYKITGEGTLFFQ